MDFSIYELIILSILLLYIILFYTKCSYVYGFFDGDNQIYSYVKHSRNRQEVIKIIVIAKYKIPSEIRDEWIQDSALTSNVLRDLKEHNIVECINPKAKTRRTYKLTELGLRIFYDL